MKPQRIQRKRTKGWKMPPNTVYVGRPTQYGNYYTKDRILKALFKEFGWFPFNELQHELYTLSRELYRTEINLLTNNDKSIPLWLESLKGKNLACWCPLKDKGGNAVPCHADVLLEIANR